MGMGIRAQSTVSYIRKMPWVGTGEVEIEGSMRKSFVKNLNLSWVFEEIGRASCRERV